MAASPKPGKEAAIAPDGPTPGSSTDCQTETREAECHQAIKKFEDHEAEADVIVVCVDSNKLIEKKTKESESSIILNHVCALRNGGGGSLYIHIHNHATKNWYHGWLDEIIDTSLLNMIEDGAMFTDVYKKSWGSENNDTHDGFLCIVVLGATLFSTVDFHTYIQTDHALLPPNAYTVFRFMTNNTKKKNTEERNPRGITLGQTYECRNIQFKEITEDNSHSTATDIYSKMKNHKVKGYISAFAKQEGGGSFYLGVKELKKKKNVTEAEKGKMNANAPKKERKKKGNTLEKEEENQADIDHAKEKENQEHNASKTKEGKKEDKILEKEEENQADIDHAKEKENQEHNASKTKEGKKEDKILEKEEENQADIDHAKEKENQEHNASKTKEGKKEDKILEKEEENQVDIDHAKEKENQEHNASKTKEGKKEDKILEKEEENQADIDHAKEKENQEHNASKTKEGKKEDKILEKEEENQADIDHAKEKANQEQNASKTKEGKKEDKILEKEEENQADIDHAKEKENQEHNASKTKEGKKKNKKFEKDVQIELTGFRFTKRSETTSTDSESQNSQGGNSRESITDMFAAIKDKSKIDIPECLKLVKRINQDCDNNLSIFEFEGKKVNQIPSEKLYKTRFYDAKSEGDVYLEISVSHYPGLVFTDKNGPLSYIWNRSTKTVEVLSADAWFETIRSKF